MTFPIRRPGRDESGEYRGFYVWAVTENTGDSESSYFETTLYVQSPVPTPQLTLERWSPRTENPFSWTPSNPGAIAVGDPEFDRIFVVSGEVDLVRRIMNDHMTAWLKSIDWYGSALRGLHEIDFGAKPITIPGHHNPIECQYRVDFVIDFLLRTPRDTWPAPSAGTVASA
ncbi:MAG TPA: hypothetical protein VF444_07315 [Pseudonocardiaceae bacterium]